MKTILRQVVEKAVNAEFPQTAGTEITFNIDATNNPEHGDYATNAAMQLTKLLKRNPRDIAQAITANILNQKHEMVEKVDIAGPGFINITLKSNAFQNWLSMLLKDSSILKSKLGGGRKAMVEFVSANPTGPLHIGHGRGAAIGDSVAAILAAAGYEVTREYYVNDAGNQMNNLAKSIYSRYCEIKGKDYPFPEDGYKGDYIADVAKIIEKEFGDELLSMDEKKALTICRYLGGKAILDEIDNTLRNFNVKIERYFSELSLYEEEKVPAALEALKAKGAVYDKDGAVWLSTKAKGDEEDRVLQKSDSSYTYLMPDIAYHDNKFQRGYELLVDVWGADHHGYIKRMESALEYLGHDSKALDIILVQMVGLVRGGEKVSMSTRSGEFVTLDWLIDEVGVDAARYFYNMRSANSQFEFDIDLAKSRSNDNPVYYVQYAHARVASLYAKAEKENISIKRGENLELLTLDAEKNIIKRMMEFSTVLETAANLREPHRIAYYLQELAGEFHSYYYNTSIVVDDLALAGARLSLCTGVAEVIKFGLQLLGVSAPDRM